MSLSARAVAESSSEAEALCWVAVLRWSIAAVIWVAVGGRGTLVGPLIGAVAVNFGKTWFTGVLPEVWLYALGALFVLVTLFLPKGIVGLWDRIMAGRGKRVVAAEQAS